MPMKYIVAGDIHGSVYHANFLADRTRELKPQKVILLGDIYGAHYNKDIDAAVLSAEVPVVAVEGNCDFHLMDMSALDAKGLTIIENINGRKWMFAHGHIYNRYLIPETLKAGDVFVYGHTHTYGFYKEKGIYFINAGSAAQPRGGTKNSFVFINGETIEIRNVENGCLIDSLELK